MRHVASTTRAHDLGLHHAESRMLETIATNYVSGVGNNMKHRLDALSNDDRCKTCGESSSNVANWGGCGSDNCEKGCGHVRVLRGCDIEDPD